MKRLYNNKNLVRQIKNRRLWRDRERNGVIGILIFEVFWIFSEIVELAGIFATRLFDYVTIFNAVLVFLGIGTDRSIANNRGYLNKLGDDISLVSGEECIIDRLKDIEIIPKNIKVGECLEASNAFDIFKGGHYILVSSLPRKFVLQQVEEEDKNRVDILEYEEAATVIEQLVKDGNMDVTKGIDFISKLVNKRIEETSIGTDVEDAMLEVLSNTADDDGINRKTLSLK